MPHFIAKHLNVSLGFTVLSQKGHNRCLDIGHSIPPALDFIIIRCDTGDEGNAKVVWGERSIEFATSDLLQPRSPLFECGRRYKKIRPYSSISLFHDGEISEIKSNRNAECGAKRSKFSILGEGGLLLIISLCRLLKNILSFFMFYTPL